MKPPIMNKNNGNSCPKKRDSKTNLTKKKSTRPQQIKPRVNSNTNVLSNKRSRSTVGFEENDIKGKKIKNVEEEVVEHSKATTKGQKGRDKFEYGFGVEIKKTLATWRDIKKQKEELKPSSRAMEIKKLREEARIQIDQMNNTARINENMDSMRDFYMLIHNHDPYQYRKDERRPARDYSLY